jgi:hypothetical protein
MLEQHQAQAREILPQCRGYDRQEVRANGGDQTDPDLSGQRILMSPGKLAHCVYLLQDSPRPRHDLFADVGEHDPTLAALDEIDPELLLQLLDLCAKGGLADEAPLGGPPEMSFLGQGHEIPECPNAHS